MEIFIDSADPEEISELHSFGIIDGVTTNPSLMAKTEGDFYKTAKKICKIVSPFPVSLEVSSDSYEEMLIQGKKLFSLAENVVLKLPMTWDGIKACNYFTSNGHHVNMTLCFSATQALLAAKASATYVSPFIGRLDDAGEDGLELVADIREIFSNYDFNTKILAASIRSIYHIYQATLIGADVITAPGKIIRQLIEHPLTDKGLEIFANDWKKSGLKI
ncbi:MAG: transaldolase family protein [Rickettsiaceae bacterium]|nr:transaldolase family protein [Rickettsiaceae bacterium]